MVWCPQGTQVIHNICSRSINRLSGNPAVDSTLRCQIVTECPIGEAHLKLITSPICRIHSCNGWGLLPFVCYCIGVAWVIICCGKHTAIIYSGRGRSDDGVSEVTCICQTVSLLVDRRQSAATLPHGLCAIILNLIMIHLMDNGIRHHSTNVHRTVH